MTTDYKRIQAIFSFVTLLLLSACSDSDRATSDSERLQITTSENPQYSGRVELDPDKEYYQVGDEVTATARPLGRFEFKSWEGDIEENAPNPFEGFIVDSDASIIAHFEAGYITDRAIVTPHQNVYYLGNARDLFFQVHQNGDRLVSLTTNGDEIDYTSIPFNGLPEAEDLTDSKTIKITSSVAESLGSGKHEIRFEFESGIIMNVELALVAAGEEKHHDLNIVSFYVEHGDAVLAQLPNGEMLMMDTSTVPAAEKYIVPFLKKHLPKDENGIQRIDHVFLSHWHYDHFSGVGALLENFEIGQVRYNLAKPPNHFGDYDDKENPSGPYGYGEYGFPPEHWDQFYVGNVITDIGGDDIEIKILNAPVFDKDDERFEYYRSEYFEQYDNRNNRSLHLQIHYGDFVYTMGGDIYQHAQRAILETFGEEVRTHIYHANHHFHGGVYEEHLIATDPILFLTSANAAVYDRDAYTRGVLDVTVPELEATSNRFIEGLLSFEVGIAVLRVDGTKDWSDDSTDLWYETYYLNDLFEAEYNVPHLFYEQ
ncbi:hypothetical protein BH23BAC3_BH23BAC3_04340 [soil metagenome]